MAWGTSLRGYSALVASNPLIDVTPRLSHMRYREHTYPMHVWAWGTSLRGYSALVGLESPHRCNPSPITHEIWISHISLAHVRLGYIASGPFGLCRPRMPSAIQPRAHMPGRRCWRMAACLALHTQPPSLG